MSLVVTVYVREGIVMAADSRLTLNAQKTQGTESIVNLAVGQSDSNRKLFLTPDGVGIATFGEAAIDGVPIAGYVESFIDSDLRDEATTVEDVAMRLSTHFGSFTPAPNTQFHVAGYSQLDGEIFQEAWKVNIAKNEIKRLNPTQEMGASWGGEGDILARLIQPVAQIDKDSDSVHPFPVYPIPYGFFTLQDAVDFAVFAIRSTIDAIRFQPRAKTVGGPIDVLVIKPAGAEWVQRKKLSADH